MRIFVAGATGAVGQNLLPMLVAAGHEVIGSTRSPSKAAAIERTGAEVVVMDGLDRESVRRAIGESTPNVVVHQMTSLAALKSMKKFDQEFATTNRLRSEGTDLLLAAAEESGVERFIAQSFTGWTNERSGSLIKDESDPLDPTPTQPSRETLAAIRHVEQVVPAAALEGLVLRYGLFYGPGTSIAPGGDTLEAIRKRRVPIIGDGAGLSSFIHTYDAATATARAIDHGAPGLYNIVDDEPAASSVWLPYVAEVLGVKPPMRVPTWLGRAAAGEHVVSMMTLARGSSNAKAKRDLDWQLKYPSWRDGFQASLAT